MNERLEFIHGRRDRRVQGQIPLLNRRWSLRGRWRKLARCPVCGEDIVLDDRIVYIYGEAIHAGCAVHPTHPDGTRMG